MPLYEYYCEKCDKVFEALGLISASDAPARCARCGAVAARIMPTTVATMSHRQGWAQRVPFHHKQVRDEAPARTIARVKPKPVVKPKTATKRAKKSGARKR